MVPGGDGGKVHQLGHVAHQNTLKFYGQSNGDINKVARVFVTNIMLILVGVPHLSDYSFPTSTRVPLSLDLTGEDPIINISDINIT